MKSEHRHELKSNELAEWLENFPGWAKENAKMIIGLTAAVLIIGGLYSYWRYDKEVLQVNEQVDFSNLLGQVPETKLQIVSAISQGEDVSHFLIPQAENLEIFASNSSNSNMSALALLTKADALRAELHYRIGSISEKDLNDQISQARESYYRVIQKAPDNNFLVAAAKFGLGLCAEELGDFEEAKQIYNEILDTPDFEGTITVTQAKQRLENLSVYQDDIVFYPAPVSEPNIIIGEPITLGTEVVYPPDDANSAADFNFPTEFSQPVNIDLPNDSNLSDSINLPVEFNLSVNEQTQADIDVNSEDSEITPVGIEPGQVPVLPIDTPEATDANVPVE